MLIYLKAMEVKDLYLYVKMVSILYKDKVYIKPGLWTGLDHWHVPRFALCITSDYVNIHVCACVIVTCYFTVLRIGIEPLTMDPVPQLIIDHTYTNLLYFYCFFFK